MGDQHTIRGTQDVAAGTDIGEVLAEILAVGLTTEPDDLPVLLRSQRRRLDDLDLQNRPVR